MALMELKGMTEEDFAANHPAGQLGKRLALRARDLMHASPNIAPSAGWLAVVKAISTHALGAVNVVDDSGSRDALEEVIHDDPLIMPAGCALRRRE